MTNGIISITFYRRNPDRSTTQWGIFELTHVPRQGETVVITDGDGNDSEGTVKMVEWMFFLDGGVAVEIELTD